MKPPPRQRVVQIKVAVLVFMALNALHAVNFSPSHLRRADQEQDVPIKPLPTWSDRSGESTEQRYRIVIAVPGHGDATRLPKLKATLEALQQSALSRNVGFGCLVYVWKEDLMVNTTNQLNMCLVLPSHGLWTHHLIKVGRNESRSLIENTTHVSILMDDVDASSVNLPRFLDTMERANLTVAAPSVVDYYPSSFPRPYCKAHMTQYVDMLFTTFTKELWLRYQGQIDTTINEYGWGYDMTLADFCNATIGVIDHEHMAHEAATESTRSYSKATAQGQMAHWIQLHKPNERPRRYFLHVTMERPRTLPYCLDVAFFTNPPPVQDDLFLDSTNGVMKSAMNGAKNGHEAFVSSIPQPALNLTHHDQPHAIELVGSIEDFFGSSENGAWDTALTEKWVGFSHSVSFSGTNRSSSGVQAADFVASAPHCIALFVYTVSMAEAVSKQLTEKKIKNIRVCPVHHPIRHSGTHNAAVKPLIDWKVVTGLRGSAAVVLWDQPYSRV